MTSTEIAHTNSAASGALSLSPGQTDWSPQQLAVVKQLGLEGAAPEELKVFLHICQQTGLDPFARQIYGIMREQWNPRTRRKEPKLTIQTGIDGFRLSASRPDRKTGRASGFEGRVGPLWCGKDGVWSDVWLQEGHPYAAKCGVYKAGYRDPIWAVCLYSEYVQTKADGTPNSFWQSMPAAQLGKCSEAAALRAAFPQDLSGVYAPEEMGHVVATEEAARTIDVAPMRSEEEQDQWDAMATAEKALDAAALKTLYGEAAKAKNDPLVAAITAAGFRVRNEVARTAREAAAEQPAVEAEESLEDEVVEADLVPEEEPVEEESPPDPLLDRDQQRTLLATFRRKGLGGKDQGQVRHDVILEVIGHEVQSSAQLTVAEGGAVIKHLETLPDAPVAGEGATVDVPLPDPGE